MESPNVQVDAAARGTVIRGTVAWRIGTTVTGCDSIPTATMTVPVLRRIRLDGSATVSTVVAAVVTATIGRVPVAGRVMGVVTMATVMAAIVVIACRSVLCKSAKADC